ncbi:MAG: DUF4258 domain-containing protein [Eubacterium sp.]|nr:DUF4258 domain-containing protein [Eubacterium sp.]
MAASYIIEQFKNLNAPENMILTQHSRKRFSERGIKIADIINAISSGEIIEQYPEDFPVPSCLILGSSGSKKLHIVASIKDNMIWLITAYIPDDGLWDESFRIRKKRSEDSQSDGKEES